MLDLPIWYHDCITTFLLPEYLHHTFLNIITTCHFPLQHLRSLVTCLQRVHSLTSIHHEDHNELAHVVKVMKSTCHKVMGDHSRNSLAIHSVRSTRSTRSTQRSQHSQGSTASRSSTRSSQSSGDSDTQSQLMYGRDC